MAGPDQHLPVTSDAIENELGDTLLQMRNEERGILLVGTALSKAFMADHEFRDQIRPLITILARKCASAKLTREFHYQDSINTYLCSAYHAARACEELYKFAIETTKNPYQFDFLFKVMHSLGPSVVFELNNALELLTLDDVLQSLELTKVQVLALFSPFTDLKDARDALAHQADRDMGYFRGKPRSERHWSTHRQSYGQGGSRLFSLKKFSSGQPTPIEFAIDVNSERILTLIQDLKSLLDANEAASEDTEP